MCVCVYDQRAAEVSQTPSIFIGDWLTAIHSVSTVAVETIHHNGSHLTVHIIPISNIIYYQKGGPYSLPVVAVIDCE